ncbi:hypothetical protein DRO91_09310, partial [Candidatus Heimdallarchaeota archaeon]
MTTIVFAAHPDDETIGCGGTVAKLSKEEEVISVIFSLGQSWPPWKEKSKVISIRTKEARKASRILGIKKQYSLDLRDMKILHDFDEYKKKELKNIFKKHSPDKVFYHSEFDGHPDHLAVNSILKDFLKQINYQGKEFKYEINLWNWFKYNPYYIFDITDTFERKMRAIKVFKSQWVWVKPLEYIMRAKA